MRHHQLFKNVSTEGSFTTTDKFLSFGISRFPEIDERAQHESRCFEVVQREECSQ